MTTENQSAQQPAEITSERLPFDAQFFVAANEFCNNALTAVPELHGIAIVPLWQPAPEQSPAGLFRLRNPQPPFLASLLMLMQRLTAFSVEAHRDMIGQLKMFDGYANELAAQIKARREELAAMTNTQDAPTSDNA